MYNFVVHFTHNIECPPEADVAMEIVNYPMLPVLTPPRGRSRCGQRLFATDQ